MIFLENFQRGGGVIFNAKFMLHILDLCIGLFSDVFQKKLQHYFTKMKGGGRSQAVWNFSENLSVLVALPVPLEKKNCREISSTYDMSKTFYIE